MKKILNFPIVSIMLAAMISLALYWMVDRRAATEGMILQAQTEENRRFDALSSQYLDLRNQWLAAAGEKLANADLRPSFAAYLYTARDLSQLNNFKTNDDGLAVSAMVWQVNKDLILFGESIGQLHGRLLAH